MFHGKMGHVQTVTEATERVDGIVRKEDEAIVSTTLNTAALASSANDRWLIDSGHPGILVETGSASAWCVMFLLVGLSRLLMDTFLRSRARGRLLYPLS